MGKPTLNAWEICSVGFWFGRSGSFARPEAVAGYPARCPQAFGREDKQERFPSIVIRYLTFEYIGVRSERRELKHLSTCRKGHQPRLRK